MIELAPQHKTGLPLARPIMPATGFFGYGQSIYPTIINAGQFGAVVTGPVTLRPQPHLNPPQVIETGGGVVFNTPPRNPGVKRAISRYKRFWRRAEIPTIIHLPADSPDDLSRTAGALAGLDLIAGLELGLPHRVSAHDASVQIRAIQQRSELPLLAKMSFDDCHHLAGPLLEAGIDALVITANPAAATFRADGTHVSGTYYGPGLIAPLMPHLLELRTRFPDAPLIVSGGIHTIADVRTCLHAGAVAVQLDTIIFINPAQVAKILGASYV